LHFFSLEFVNETGVVLKKSILLRAAKTEETPTGTIEGAEGGYSQANLNTPFEGLLAESVGHKI
jgi:hypothetical protein